MDFNEKMSAFKIRIEDCLKASLENKDGLIYEAMRYSLLSGGKRIRPILCMGVCEALGGDMPNALTAGCALEMIHTYSLIHDDLPCMDNDDLRRGNPTSHKVFGEATAVLAGDALLNFACEFLMTSDMEKSLKADLCEILFSASGANGMIGGQILDLDAEIHGTDFEGLCTLHKKKTGALINAAAQMGATISGKDRNILLDYSSSLGLAFQICDDILDIKADEKVLGKPVQSDIKNNKTTFVSLSGLDGAQKKLGDETKKAIDSLAFLGEKAWFLKEFAIFLLNRKF